MNNTRGVNRLELPTNLEVKMVHSMLQLSTFACDMRNLLWREVRAAS